MSSSAKIAIVTGSNKGIGKSIVQQLCQQFKGTVYLTARNEKLGREAIADLEKLGLKPQFHQLDIDDEKSINNLRDYIKSKYGGLDILVNNAAIAYKNSATEPIGVQAENTLRVNFTGTNNVCKALFPLLRSHARVVNVSSSVGHLMQVKGKEPEAEQLRNKLSSPDLTEGELISLMDSFIQAAKDGKQWERGWQSSTYSASKVGLSALTRIQQREMDKSRPGEDILINHVHPGYVDTDMTSHTGPLTTEEGAKSSVFAALLPENSDVKGAYIWRDNSIIDWTKPNPKGLGD